MVKRRIGIVGFGSLGQYLYKEVVANPCFELAFVWNRSKAALSDIPRDHILDQLEDVHTKAPDLIVEVAHPLITRQFGALFLSVCDFLLGSPTAIADRQVEQQLQEAVNSHGHGLYVPSGAFWGGDDIRKMAERGSLRGLTVTMTKHPNSLKLNGELQEKNSRVTDQLTVLYEGPVRELCPLAPNNVNTMAAAAIAATNLGLDGTIGRLVADPNLSDWHIVEVDARGPVKPDGHEFSVLTVRKNPADRGAVTGTATYGSFVSSMLRAQGKGKGWHLC